MMGNNEPAAPPRLIPLDELPPLPGMPGGEEGA
jgi:hypothetical protein